MNFTLRHYRVTALLQEVGPNNSAGAWQRVILRCSEMELSHVLSALHLSGSGQYDVTQEDLLRNLDQPAPAPTRAKRTPKVYEPEDDDAYPLGAPRT